jgi:hypothetical protein
MFGTRGVLLVAGLGATFAVLTGCSREQFNTYTLAAGTEPGWVIVEFENPGCPALPKDLIGRSIAVPSSRYVCSSDSMRVGLAPDRYFLEGPSGRTRLELDRDIHHLAAFTFGAGEGRCRMVGEAFFFGPSTQLTKSEDYSALYPLQHQGCDPSVHATAAN